MRALRGTRRCLRSPRLIVAEVLAIALSGVVLTLVPQAHEQTPLQLLRHAEDHPFLDRVAHALACDRVLESRWFAGLVVLAGASLALVLVEQWRRAYRLWREPLTVASFDGALFRRELERGATGDGPRASFSTRGRVGLLGSPLLHLGLMLVLGAGLGRVLFGQAALAELVEGETLAAAPSAYVRQWGGPLARPFALRAPLLLERLAVTRHADGTLKRMEAEVYLGAGRDRRRAPLKVNTPLELGREQLFLSPEYGPAALVEIRSGADSARLLVLLHPARDGRTYEAATSFSGGLEIRLRGVLEPDGTAPRSIEFRLVQPGALRFVGSLGPGAGVDFGTGERLDLHGVRLWAQLKGSRDQSASFAYAGFLLAALGAVIIFTVARLDTCVSITPTPSGERVLVALRVQRFAPLYRERFAALCREHLDPAAPG